MWHTLFWALEIKRKRNLNLLAEMANKQRNKCIIHNIRFKYAGGKAEVGNDSGGSVIFCSDIGGGGELGECLGEEHPGRGHSRCSPRQGVLEER